MKLHPLCGRLASVLLLIGATTSILHGCAPGREPEDRGVGEEAADVEDAGETARADSAGTGNEDENGMGDTSTGAAAGSDSAGFVLENVGFQTPESVLHDEAADVYLVSNINGQPFEKDDNGFISRISPEGRLLELKWIDGAAEGVTLHSPKGTAIRGDSLFVADLDTVRIFDRTSGEALGGLGVPGASMLNDLATGPDGTLYVTDTGVRPAPGGAMEPSGTDALYRFDPAGRPVAVAKGEKLGRPNGVAVDDRGPVVVTFGSGKVLRVGTDGAVRELAGPPKGQLDGVVLLGEGGMIVTGWEGKAVYHITTEGEVHTIWQDIESPADLGYDSKRKRMLVPSFMGNFVEARTTN